MDIHFAEVMAQGLLRGRFSLWMDSGYWRVTGYRLSGDDIRVHMTRKDDMKKTFKNRRETVLNRNEFLEVCNRNYKFRKEN